MFLSFGQVEVYQSILKTVSLIDIIFTNFIFDTSLKPKTRIIKSYASERFPVFFSLNSSSKIYKENQKTTIHKRVMHDTKLTVFKKSLHNVNWNSINHSPKANSKYEILFKLSSEVYEKHFP